MHRLASIVLCALALLAVLPDHSSATLSSYSRVASTGSAVDMTGATTLFTVGAQQVAGFTIPFTFFLDGVGYNRVSVTTNGLMSLGNGNAGTSGSNSLITSSTTPTGQGQFPRIASWWDQLYLKGDAGAWCSGRSQSIAYKIVGSAPNRIVAVEWQDLELANGSRAYSSWQVRLYEGTNAIEFFYPQMSSASCYYTGSTYSTSATIGIADATNDFISVTPRNTVPTFSTTSANNSANLSSTTQRMPANTLLSFTPCNVALAGDLTQGGTEFMGDGDTLFATTGVMRGDIGVLQPFTIMNPTSGCVTRSYSMAIMGPNASEYSLSTSAGSIDVGSSVTPTITFTPGAPGVRHATLRITDNNGFLRTYPLAATSISRIGRISSPADGGTADLADGDTLMRSIHVLRHDAREVSPMTIVNTNPNPSAPTASVSFAIDSAGLPSTQYQIVGPSSMSLGAGESFTPVIRFSPTSIFEQPARLVVNADGEIRTYTLLGLSMVPAIAASSMGAVVDEVNPVFNNSISCVGEVVTSVTSVPLVIENIGTRPLVINDIDVYLTDTTYRQGPTLRLARDGNGTLAKIDDYVISDQPARLPLSTGQNITTPFTIDSLASRTVWVTFVGELPGKRFGRAFIRTNAENVFGIDTNVYDNESTFPTRVEGLFTTDLLGRANGAKLAADLSGARLRGIGFPNTDVGESSEMSFTIANTGACDLRIGRNQFRITSGDVNEFTIVRALRLAGVDNQTGDYLLAPGVVDTVTVRFTPSRNGSRMATLWLKTNDSTVLNPGIASRGAYFLDLAGNGLAGLEAADVVLDPVVIGGSVSGTATLENTQTFPITVSSIDFEGDDAAQFSESGTWPTRPLTVLPGDKLKLGVMLTPTGDAGARRAYLRLVTTGGDTVRVRVIGEAGTQALLVSPTALFEKVTIGVAQSFRQTVMITNNGTLPVRINDLRIVGPDSLNYRLGLMPRRTLDPGQTEYLEVTYAPRTPGLSSATLEVVPHSGPVQSVALGGNALKARLDPADPTYSANPGRQGDITMPRNGPARPGATIR